MTSRKSFVEQGVLLKNRTERILTKSVPSTLVLAVVLALSGSQNQERLSFSKATGPLKPDNKGISLFSLVQETPIAIKDPPEPPPVSNELASLELIHDEKLGAGYETTGFLSGRNMLVRIFGYDRDQSAQIAVETAAQWHRLEDFFGPGYQPYTALVLVRKESFPSEFSPDQCSDIGNSCLGLMYTNENSREHEETHAFNFISTANGKRLSAFDRILDESIACFWQAKDTGALNNMLSGMVTDADHKENIKIAQAGLKIADYYDQVSVLKSLGARGLARIDKYARNNGHPEFLSQLLTKAREKAFTANRPINANDLLKITDSLYPPAREEISAETVLFVMP